MTHYDLLGLSMGASDSEVKKAYRKMALKHHPDKNPSTESADVFKRLVAANDVLSDKSKRREYDLQLQMQGFQRMNSSPQFKKEKFTTGAAGATAATNSANNGYRHSANTYTTYTHSSTHTYFYTSKNERSNGWSDVYNQPKRKQNDNGQKTGAEFQRSTGSSYWNAHSPTEKTGLRPQQESKPQPRQPATSFTQNDSYAREMPQDPMPSSWQKQKMQFNTGYQRQQEQQQPHQQQQQQQQQSYQKYQFEEQYTPQAPPQEKQQVPPQRFSFTYSVPLSTHAIPTPHNIHQRRNKASTTYGRRPTRPYVTNVNNINSYESPRMQVPPRVPSMGANCFDNNRHRSSPSGRPSRTDMEAKEHVEFTTKDHVIRETEDLTIDDDDDDFGAGHGNYYDDVVEINEEEFRKANVTTPVKNTATSKTEHESKENKDPNANNKRKEHQFFDIEELFTDFKRDSPGDQHEGTASKRQRAQDDAFDLNDLKPTMTHETEVPLDDFEKVLNETTSGHFTKNPKIKTFTANDLFLDPASFEGKVFPPPPPPVAPRFDQILKLRSLAKAFDQYQSDSMNHTRLLREALMRRELVIEENFEALVVERNKSALKSALRANRLINKQLNELELEMKRVSVRFSERLLDLERLREELN